MSTIALWLSKAWLIGAMAVSAVIPGVSPLANSLSASPAATPSYPRLQQAWAREQRVYSRQTRFYDNVDAREQRAQQLIDRAKANGKDVSALQSALAAFESTVKQAQPVFESTKGIVASHQGFDASGTVTDPVKAFQTVLDMHGKLKDVRQTILPSARALREAIRDFRAANQPAATPTP
jgi:hypothetical protein